MNRTPVIHVVIMDGTLSSLGHRQETNAGLTLKLLREVTPDNRLSLTYEEGIQWCNWRSVVDLAAGVGINGQIRRAYGRLSSQYRPGDKIFFFGFSRGAYAVRSLAGVIDRIGLLKPRHAVERNIRQAFRYYGNGVDAWAATAFSKKFCQNDIQIEMIGVWDTVKALGIAYPVLWRLAPAPTDFHDHDLGATTKAGFHALALDENRRAFTPVLWSNQPDWQGRLQQVWFRGSHADIGGHISNFPAARPLSNIPLVWMLGKAEDCSLPLPENWRARFPVDGNAPAHGSNRGIGKYFLLRKKRTPFQGACEELHESAK